MWPNTGGPNCQKQGIHYVIFRGNASGSWIHSAKVSRVFVEVNKALCKLYLLACSKTFTLVALSLLRKLSSLLTNWVNRTLVREVENKV